MEVESNDLNAQEAQEFRNEMIKETWGDDAAVSKTPVNNDLPPEDLSEDPPEPPPEDPPEVVDPWEGVSPVLKEQFESLQTKVNDYDAMAERLKNAERRIGGITNQLHEEKKAAEAAQEAAQQEKDSAPSKEEIDAAAKSKEEWDGLRKDFPEWAKAMDNRLAAERADIDRQMSTTKGLQEKINKLEEIVQNNPAVTESISGLQRQINEEMVSIRHPGWRDMIKTKEFGEFYQTLNDQDKQRYTSDKASDAIYLLDLYTSKKDGKKPDEIADKRRERLDASELPPSGKRSTPKKSEKDMSDQEYRQQYSQKLWDDS